MARLRILGMIMAGGKGDRLFPLTKARSKPAAPFAGKHRIIDFVLSNFINSGVYAVYLLVQYKSQSLIEHSRSTWRWRIGGGLKDTFITVVPPQMRQGETWYQGTADAVYQNINVIRDFHPDLIAVFRRRPHLPHGSRTDGQVSSGESCTCDDRSTASAAGCCAWIRDH